MIGGKDLLKLNIEEEKVEVLAKLPDYIRESGGPVSIYKNEVYFLNDLGDEFRYYRVILNPPSITEVLKEENSHRPDDDDF